MKTSTSVPGHPLPESRCIVKNDPYGMTVARTDAADAVPQIDPVHSTRALHRPMMHGKQDGFTLP